MEPPRSNSLSVPATTGSPEAFPGASPGSATSRSRVRMLAGEERQKAAYEGFMLASHAAVGGALEKNREGRDVLPCGNDTLRDHGQQGFGEDDPHEELPLYVHVPSTFPELGILVVELDWLLRPSPSPGGRPTPSETPRAPKSTLPSSGGRAAGSSPARAVW